MKIGIIQSSPLPADLSGNLRRIVQGYRDCIDHGAELVIAPAGALCGPNLRGLAERPSFRYQHTNALRTLSSELCNIPLILGSYAQAEEPYEPDAAEDLRSSAPKMIPYILESFSVTEMEDGEVFTHKGERILVTTEEREIFPDVDEPSYIIHLPTSAWSVGCERTERQRLRSEAINNEAAVICVHPACTAEQNVYGGGSCVYDREANLLTRLPWFEPADVTVNTRGRCRTAEDESAPEPQLRQMLLTGIRESVQRYGYTGACIPMDHENSPLLAVLAADALGSRNVECVTFCGNTAFASEAGFSCRSFDTSAQEAQLCPLVAEEQAEALRQRIRAGVLTSYAEGRGLMLLSPLSRYDALSGNFTLYGESCGSLAPLGSLYRTDLHLLRVHYNEIRDRIFGSLTEPEDPEQDRLLLLMAEMHNSAGELVECACEPEEENRIRRMQRRLIASALKRTQLPFVLQTAPADCQPDIPTYHRLND